MKVNYSQKKKKKKGKLVTSSVYPGPSRALEAGRASHMHKHLNPPGEPS